MKTTAQVKLLPSPAQAQMLAATLRACNETADHIARVAHERQKTSRKKISKFDLQKIVYGEAKMRLLSAQPVIRTIGKVMDARTSHAANLKAGNYGREGTPRYAKAAATEISFRPYAAQAYDDRILSWNHSARMVSIWVIDTTIDETGASQAQDDGNEPKPGRILVPFVGKTEHLARIAAHRQGESDLVYREPSSIKQRAAVSHGVSTEGWYLLPTIENLAPALMLGHGRHRAPITRDTKVGDWMGIDLGILNIAYTSDGASWSGGAVTHHRVKNRYLRRQLQAAAKPRHAATLANTRGSQRRTPRKTDFIPDIDRSAPMTERPTLEQVRHRRSHSALKLLRKRSAKETRYVTNINHIISKQVVAEAKRTGRGIALEDLSGIRDRARFRKPQRATLHSWAFSQLGSFIEYKAKAAGVPVVYVDPAYTSQICAECGHCRKQNRDGETYTCHPNTPDRHTKKIGGCGVVAHADHNGARNIAALAPAAWRAVWDTSMHQGVSHASDAA